MQIQMQREKNGNRPFEIRVCQGVSFSLLVFLVLPDNAHAYLDAGTGSMIIQMVVAGAAAALVIGRSYWSQIKSVFVGKSSLEEAEDDEGHGDR